MPFPNVKQILDPASGSPADLHIFKNPENDGISRIRYAAGVNAFFLHAEAAGVGKFDAVRRGAHAKAACRMIIRIDQRIGKGFQDPPSDLGIRCRGAGSRYFVTHGQINIQEILSVLPRITRWIRIIKPILRE